jgi:hypothetical protein
MDIRILMESFSRSRRGIYDARDTANRELTGAGRSVAVSCGQVSMGRSSRTATNGRLLTICRHRSNWSLFIAPTNWKQGTVKRGVSFICVEVEARGSVVVKALCYYIVHLHPVAHCYFTFTFLSVFCAAYRCF